MTTRVRGEEREPEQSINFVTCHDGFTLNDVVSYNEKHNGANREGNRDGADDKRSWNCGIEGPSDTPDIEQLRNRQVNNFLSLTRFAIGTPLMLMGDEFRRMQRGNNNPYCQDNEISWMDWGLFKKHRDIHRFVKGLILMCSRRDRAEEAISPSLNEFLRQAAIHWCGVKLNQPDWSDESHSLAFTARSFHRRFLAHIMVNAYWEPLEFELSLLDEWPGACWRRCIDTALDPPEDIGELVQAVPGFTYRVEPRSVVLLLYVCPSSDF